jgi:hypothetical protein
MLTKQAESLRKALENLMNAKLQDVLTHRNALDRLIAHRSNGVSSPDVRAAELRLEEVLAELLFTAGPKPARMRAPRRPIIEREARHEESTSSGLSTERFGNDL